MRTYKKRLPESRARQRRWPAVLLGMAGLALVGPAAAQFSDESVKIGVLADMSGLYSDMGGNGLVEAVRMAIADAGGEINGKRIELIHANHAGKPDTAATQAREWFDRQGVDMIISGPSSGTSLAVAKVAAEKQRPVMVTGGVAAQLTNEECSPYTIHYLYDTVALARGTGAAMTRQGGRSWYFLTVDYAFGASLEKETAAVVTAGGGKVLGSVRHPLSASDFSSFLLQANASRAQVLGLANGGGDTINAIKAANEFGISKSMKIAGLMLFITDVHALGLGLTQGITLTEAWYWDQSDESRKWAGRFQDKMKKKPTSMQAASYSATQHYLRAVKAAGTDDAAKVIAGMKATRINDMYAQNGYIRGDGRMVHDLRLMEVKSPAESRQPWDYYKEVQRIPGEQAFASRAESRCAFWK
ncbi:ABC transporter substrate-binding protein [Cupriavidus necator]|uniref:ABC transporter permease n=1 Tax=Cupriavidus necator TaxID=106590 RepID=A0A367PR61_CUPNE|nr:ABC transporter substrate-binding protein [Cupriavidus necator]QQX86548.1 ABC transporter substrate-binding protein [Cupriavidus necator]RCJ10034.1 ABC transporter permease [Cupriavidus necator]